MSCRKGGLCQGDVLVLGFAQSRGLGKGGHGAIRIFRLQPGGPKAEPGVRALRGLLGGFVQQALGLGGLLPFQSVRCGGQAAINRVVVEPTLAAARCAGTSRGAHARQHIK